MVADHFNFGRFAARDCFFKPVGEDEQHIHLVFFPYALGQCVVFFGSGRGQRALVLLEARGKRGGRFADDRYVALVLCRFGGHAADENAEETVYNDHRKHGSDKKPHHQFAVSKNTEQLFFKN